jgi:tetratricopeptide (TPR) repeat protein
MASKTLPLAETAKRFPRCRCARVKKTRYLDQVHECFGFFYRSQGRYKEALQEFQKAYEMNPSIYPYANLACVLAKAGKRDEALKIVDELEGLSARQYVPPVQIAMIYSGLGQKERAFQWLEKALEKHDTGLAN